MQHRSILAETLSLTKQKLGRQEQHTTLPIKNTVLALPEAKGLANFSQMKLSTAGKQKPKTKQNKRVWFKNLAHIVTQI